MFAPLNQTLEQARATFLQSGYLIIEGDRIWGRQKADLLNRCHVEIQRLADYGYELIDQNLLAQPGAKPMVDDADSRSRGCKFVFERIEQEYIRPNFSSVQAVLKLVNGVGTFSEHLKNVTRHPNLLRIFSNLLASDTFEQIICQVHFKEPRDGSKFNPHMDFQNRIDFDSEWKDMNGQGSYAVAIIAINDHTTENGCLYTIPGIASLAEPPRDKALLAKLISDSDQAKGIALRMKAGDVLFMHPYNIHWSSENTSNISRYTLLSGMCSVGATTVDYPGVMCKLKARSVGAHGA